MTITYQELSRDSVKRGGIDLVAEFTDSETGQKQVKAMYFSKANPSTTAVTNRLNHNAARFEFKVNPLNELDVDEVDVRGLLKVLVQYIRNHPDCTFTQVVTAADTAYPYLPWKPEKILLYIQNYLQNRLKITFTFAQFKTYVINHKFSGVDG